MIEDALYTIAGADDGIKALAGTPPRFYPSLAPQAPEYPFCVYHAVSETVPNAMGKSTDLLFRRYQIDCWGASATAARTLADAVQKAFDRYSGVVNPGAGQTTIQDVLRMGVTDLFDEQARRYKRSVDLQFAYLES